MAVVVELDDDFGNIPEGNPAWLDAHREWMTVGQWGLGARAWWRREAERQDDGSRWVGLGTLAPVSNVAAEGVQGRRPGDVHDPGAGGAVRPARPGRGAPQPGAGAVPRGGGAAPRRDGGGLGRVGRHPRRGPRRDRREWPAVAETGAGRGRGSTSSAPVCGAPLPRLAEAPTATGWVELDEWPDAFGALDVGIVPLAPNRFNEAKSSLKMLEMAAVGCLRWCPRRRTTCGSATARVRDDPLRRRPVVVRADGGAARRPGGAGARQRVSPVRPRPGAPRAHAGRWHDAWATALANRRHFSARRQHEPPGATTASTTPQAAGPSTMRHRRPR